MTENTQQEITTKESKGFRPQKKKSEPVQLTNKEARAQYWFNEDYARWMVRWSIKGSQFYSDVLDLIAGESGISLKGKRKRAILQLFINCYYTQTQTRGESVRVSLDNNANKSGTEQHYILGISGAILREVVHTISQASVFDFKEGVWVADGDNLTSKIRLSESFMDKLEGILVPEFIPDNPPPVIYKDKDGNRCIAPPNKAKSMRGFQVDRANTMSKEASIILDGEELPLTDRFVQRQFASGKCVDDGREYGAVWENTESWKRETMLISGHPVVTVDIVSTHPLIAYALAGIDITAFTESVYHCSLLDPNNSYHRALAKSIFLRLFNVKAKSKAGCVNSVRKSLTSPQDRRKRVDQALKEANEKIISEALNSIPGVTLEMVISALYDRNSILADTWFLNDGDSWKELNRIESDILIDVKAALMDEGVLALGIHDAVMVPAPYAELAADIYRQAISMRLGMEFKYPDKLVDIK
ncbi:hypothetical protein [uncultured Microbulbifer sp.]|uniref:hypothetical protein n=1 Tax=uncultured Microbulbifer sp. TaxID=348147 RepID=UPI0026337B9E|nr:hypothetical protein [uncultured Microbulbifer sp.]